MKNLHSSILLLLAIISITGCSHSNKYIEQKRIGGNFSNTGNTNDISADECKEFGGDVAGFTCTDNDKDFGIVSDVKGSDRHCCKLTK